MPCARFAAERLLPGEGHDIELRPVELLREGGRGGVGDGQALAVGGDPVAIGHAHAGGGAVPGEDHVMVEIDRAEVRRSRHRRALRTRASFSFSCLTMSVTQPSPKLSQASTSTGARAEQRPHRHFHRAGVGGGHDADAVIGGNLQDFAGQVDGELQLGLADLGAMRTAERRVLERFERPAGALGAGTGRKIGVFRQRGGLFLCHSILPDGRLALGRDVPMRRLRRSFGAVKRHAGQRGSLPTPFSPIRG